MSERESWTLLDRRASEVASGNTLQNSFPPEIAVDGGQFTVNQQTLRGGKSEGISLITIGNGVTEVTIIPTRGMGIWKIQCGDLRIGWNSPVEGPVHPTWVPVHDPGGLGWLEGFDELMVRCGLNSNGAPDFDIEGRLRYPLHGRIANLPASEVRLEVDRQRGELSIVGTVFETRFLIYSLRLVTRLTLKIGQPTIHITDEVTNMSANAASMQLLYHINVGSPILGAGSRVHLATERIVPRNAHSANDVATWSTYQAPTPGYNEQVYLTRPLANPKGWTTALLHDADEQFGLAVYSKTNELPYTIIWKNTASEADGYVTGIEPATGFPNPRSFEEEQGRVVTLDGGQSRCFKVKLEPVTSLLRCEQIRSEISALMSGEPTLQTTPDPDWCAN